MTRNARLAAVLSCGIGAIAAAAITIFPAFASQGKEAAQDYPDGATGNLTMFVKLTDYRGRPVFIDPERVIRIRESGIADEPLGAVFIDYVSEGAFVNDTFQNIARLFGSHVKLALLHAPNGMPLFVNSDLIAAISIDHEYSGNSVAIVSSAFGNPHVLARNKVPLKEDISEATAIIETARNSAERSGALSCAGFGPTSADLRGRQR
jgi:hypothetical protein